LAKRGWRSANLSPDRRVFFGQGRGDVRSRALAARVTASFGSRGGASTADLLFPLLFPPTLISVTPNTGPTAGGTSVDLAGMDFQSGATVTFGGSLATGIVVTPTHITATTPAHASGAVNVVVTNPDLQNSTLANGFTYSDPLFVAVTNSGTVVAISTDAITWTPQVIASGLWTGIAWNGSIFAAISSDDKAASSPDGVTWTSRTIPAGGFSTVVWAPELGIFLATGDSNNLASSPDGIVWTGHPDLPGNVVGFCTAWNGLLFSTGGFGSAVFRQGGTSINGISWTDNFMPGTGNRYNAMIYAGSRFVAVSSGPARAATSPDGSTWTAQTITVNSGWRGLAYNGSRIVAVGIGSGVNDNVATSDDGGVTWISRSLPSVPGSGLAAVAWNGQVFAALAFTGTAGYSSSDGITWVQRVVPNAGYAAIAVKS